MSEAVLASLLTAARLVEPGELPSVVDDHARMLGASASALYLVDREQLTLCQMGDESSRVPIEGTIAGRVFATEEIFWSEADTISRLWVPVRDGIERLGVLSLEFGGRDDAIEPACAAFASLVAELVVTRGMYGDAMECTRRTHQMTIAAEVQWGMLPPGTFGTSRVTISGAVEPAYEIGGDAFDYAMNGDHLHFCLLDGMGHGLNAAMLVAVALATYRNARRARMHLGETAISIDGVVTGQYDGDRFVTGLLGELDCVTGELHFINAGHPAPLLIRRGRVVKELSAAPLLPFGFGDAQLAASTECLEPGDRVLIYTDGVVEARRDDGEFFGEHRLIDFIERESASGQSSPEILRRLTTAVLSHQAGALQDDSTLLLVDWLGMPHVSLSSPGV
ncbi:MAG: PP2C family protein-serine/threonine phosphatase [Mycobacteriales bacterium]